jgi:hypothetical protein
MDRKVTYTFDSAWNFRTDARKQRFMQFWRSVPTIWTTYHKLVVGKGGDSIRCTACAK